MKLNTKYIRLRRQETLKRQCDAKGLRTSGWKCKAAKNNRTLRVLHNLMNYVVSRNFIRLPKAENRVQDEAWLRRPTCIDIVSRRRVSQVCIVFSGLYGGMTELEYVSDSKSEFCGFESHSRYQNYGRLVKWLRHCPFTAVTRVRIPYRLPRDKLLLFFSNKPSKLVEKGRFKPCTRTSRSRLRD